MKSIWLYFSTFLSKNCLSSFLTFIIGSGIQNYGILSLTVINVISQPAFCRKEVQVVNKEIFIE
jgi:hypothetical protein